MGRRSECSSLLIVLGVLLMAMLSSTSTFADTRRPKNVQAALRAKWSGTPFLLEAGYVPLSPYSLLLLL